MHLCSRLVSFEEGRRHKLHCKHGVVEVMAQTVRLVWEEAAELTDNRVAPQGNVYRVEEPVIAPRILENTQASTLMSGLDDAMPSLSFQQLQRLSTILKFIVLVLGSDGASSNVRLKAYVANLVLEHNKFALTTGRILLLDVVCATHILTRAVIQTFRYQQIIPRCFSMSFCMKFPPRYNRFLRILQETVERDLLSGGYFLAAEPPGDTADHSYRMLSLVMLRPLRTRGHVMEVQSREEPVLREAFSTMIDLLNGDLRSGQVQHYCRPGCCSGARDCAMKITDALITSFVERLVV
jgi:hypothetical protein